VVPSQHSDRFKRVIVLWYRRQSDHHSRANGCGRGACQRNLPTQAGRWQLSQRGKVQGASRAAVPTPERGIRHLEFEKAITQIYAAIRSFWGVQFRFGRPHTNCGVAINGNVKNFGVTNGNHVRIRYLECGAKLSELYGALEPYYCDQISELLNVPDALVWACATLLYELIRRPPRVCSETIGKGGWRKRPD
jgi:hypothetical protein